MNKQDFLKELKNIFTFSNEPEKVEEVKSEDVKAEEVQAKTEYVTDVIEPTEEPQIDMMDAIKEIIAGFKADVDTKIEAFKTEFSQTKQKEVETKDAKIKELETELSAKPEAEPIKAKPETKADAQEAPINRFKSTKSRVFEALNNVL